MHIPDQQAAHAAAQRIGKGLEPFMLKQLITLLGGNAPLRQRAAKLLQLLQQDTSNELHLRPLDLFLPDHLRVSEIKEAARERSIEEEGERPHLTTCSVCNAFVETEAAHRVFKRGMSTDLSGLAAKVPEAPTDNDKWFNPGVPGR